MSAISTVQRRCFDVGIACAVLSTMTACGGPAETPDSGRAELDAPISGEIDTGRASEDDAFVAIDDVGTDVGAPEPCTTPGVTETLPCGMCGTIDRFCAASGAWAYGTCTGEHGECMPGTTGTEECGNCGSQEARCDATCAWMAIGACAGEGTCAPGSSTRSGDGCPAGQTRQQLCSAECAYEPAGACVADPCPRAGAIETVACGRCGTTERFCNAALTWEYGACAGEHGCVPGTTSTVECGMCGTQTARCDATCATIPTGMCAGEGPCAPGARTRTSAGCPAGQTRELECDATCGFTIERAPCASSVPVDVTFVFDQTGSNAPNLSSALATLESRCWTPLLALTDVQVGLSYSGDFAVDPYGGGADRPFEGGIEPVASLPSLMAEIGSRPTFAGGDYGEATVEALSILSGGTVHPMARALVCSGGRTAGGCWRPGAMPVIVVFSGGGIHNGPDAASSGLYLPYVGVTPAPATWPGVLAQLRTTSTRLLWMNSEAAAGDPSLGQVSEMLADLGQPDSDLINARTGNVGTACDAVVARVRALAGL